MGSAAFKLIELPSYNDPGEVCFIRNQVKHAGFLMFLGVALVLARPIVLCKAFHVVVRRMMSVESRQHQNVDGWGICIGIAGAKSRCTIMMCVLQPVRE